MLPEGHRPGPYALVAILFATIAVGLLVASLQLLTDCVYVPGTPGCQLLYWWWGIVFLGLSGIAGLAVAGLSFAAFPTRRLNPFAKGHPVLFWLVVLGGLIVLLVFLVLLMV